MPVVPGALSGKVVRLFHLESATGSTGWPLSEELVLRRTQTIAFKDDGEIQEALRPELPRTAAEQRLESGMVLALTAYVWQEGVGGVYGQEPIVITDAGPDLLSASPFREARSPIR